mmetsp:Transcript_14907/g.34601  ORF Transcript_14907/g.34601 Transcript_14907/m.34601 type:complete len:358 (-) Transcript_14907:1187-2260(-)
MARVWSLTNLMRIAYIFFSFKFSPSNCFPATAQRSFRSSSLLATEANDDKPELFRTGVLFENAREIDERIARGDVVGSYCDSMWSNRLGTVLTPIANGFYTGDRPFYWNKIDVGGRMCVIKLDDGNLWIHSPVDLDEETIDALQKLGNVKYVVSPNYEHLKYAKKWSDQYPDAFMWGCPGLSSKLQDIEWEGEIPYNLTGLSNSVQLKNCWDFDEIVPLHLNIEINPFTGRPFFNEVIFYHKQTKSLITTDVYWNYPQRDGIPNSHLEGDNGDEGLAPAVESIPFGTRLWKFGMDKIYLPFYKHLMVNDRQRYEGLVTTIIDEWDVHLLVPCHGDIIRGKEKIRLELINHFGIDSTA